ncbi:hypothetical protein WR25_08681 [Diploscapter pachys]|uniref:Uncharacterized protein n=1 Tax=Diploscapter pachys TaxID=2018661 RepID=A0A2A2LB72_9BILA|nr:hypothetical protein WR25_08681 [Diploscapter pachys]
MPRKPKSISIFRAAARFLQHRESAFFRIYRKIDMIISDGASFSRKYWLETEIVGKIGIERPWGCPPEWLRCTGPPATTGQRALESERRGRGAGPVLSSHRVRLDGETERNEDGIWAVFV